MNRSSNVHFAYSGPEFREFYIYPQQADSLPSEGEFTNVHIIYRQVMQETHMDRSYTMSSEGIHVYCAKANAEEFGKISECMPVKSKNADSLEKVKRCLELHEFMKQCSITPLFKDF